MGRDAIRKCSHCGHNGHNSRTCNEKGLMLFGVRILGEGDEEVMRKSLSMGNLASFAADQTSGDRGYLSDGPSPSERRGGRERKRGVPWTQEEHRTFLAGLEKLGKGDWRGISRNFVTTRTPTQVASHAQKYFLRQTTQNRKKRRSSLFDVVMNEKINPTFSPAMTSIAPTTIPLMEEHDVPEDTNLLHNDNYPMESPTGIAAQVAGLGLVAAPTLPLIANCGEFPDYNGMDCLAESSSSIKNQAAIRTSEFYPTLSLIPNLELSDQANPIPHKMYKTSATHTSEFLYLPSSPSPRADPHCPFQATVAAETSQLENSDLELSIAPPRPLSTTKLSSQDSNFAGYIKVV